jgi:hypothetical protein
MSALFNEERSRVVWTGWDEGLPPGYGMATGRDEANRRWIWVFKGREAKKADFIGSVGLPVSERDDRLHVYDSTGGYLGPCLDQTKALREIVWHYKEATSGGIPGETGTLQQRIAGVVENEVPVAYVSLLTARLRQTVRQWEDEAAQAARTEAQRALAALVPDQADITVAHEVADRIMAAAHISDSEDEAW